MLGRELLDPHQLEGEADRTGDTKGSAATAGLGLLPLRTRFGTSKRCAQRQTLALWPEGETLPIEGFELHHGSSEWLEGPSSATAARFSSAEDLGWWRSTASGGWVAGTYLHGVFDNGPWRRRWLNTLRSRRALPPLPTQPISHAAQRSQLLDRLADAFERHVDLTPLLAPDG
jgi:adenosylcobyric acid synthase